MKERNWWMDEGREEGSRRNEEDKRMTRNQGTTEGRKEGKKRREEQARDLQYVGTQEDKYLDR